MTKKIATASNATKPTPLSSFVTEPAPAAPAPVVPSFDDGRPIDATRELEDLRRLREMVEAILRNETATVNVFGPDNGPLDLGASLEATLVLLRKRMLPALMTQPIAEVLSFDFQDVPKIAERWRATGVEIPGSFEAEHAFVVWWLLGYALEHGSEWKAKAALDLPKLPKK